MINASQFDQFYRRTCLQLGMYALRIVGNTDDADDIVQDVFATVWQQISAGFEPDNLRAYIYKITRNRCIDFVRQRTESVADMPEIPAVDDEAIETAERDARLWRAVADLPDACRRVFLMSKRDGLTNAQIAAELGISIKTVENHMTKALRRLRAALGPNRHISFSILVFF